MFRQAVVLLGVGIGSTLALAFAVFATLWTRYRARDLGSVSDRWIAEHHVDSEQLRWDAASRSRNSIARTAIQISDSVPPNLPTGTPKCSGSGDRCTGSLTSPCTVPMHIGWYFDT